jgi:hypothetical protein
LAEIVATLCRYFPWGFHLGHTDGAVVFGSGFGFGLGLGLKIDANVDQMRRIAVKHKSAENPVSFLRKLIIHVTVPANDIRR